MAELTKNDLKILSLVADGLTTDEIADRLNRSRHTIKSQKSRIIAKLGARNMNEAVFKSIQLIANYRFENGHPDDTITENPWLARR